MLQSFPVSSLSATSCILRRFVVQPPNSGLKVLLLRRSHSTTASKSSIPQFSYSISAAYCAKGASLDLKSNLDYLSSSRSTTATDSSNGDPPSSEPRNHKLGRPKSGQDAYFLSKIADTGSIAFGVVDGVGGWQDSGVDPADFSHSLCGHMREIAASNEGLHTNKHKQSISGDDSKSIKGADNRAESSVKIRPLELLNRGFGKVVQDKTVWAGGSTACVATASRGGVLEVANLGDSGYAHIAPFRLSHMSVAQQHEFNTPFQLAKIPARLRRQMQLFGALHYDDLPQDSDLYSHSMAHGDVFVFATDGVWDNLSPEDVLNVVCGVMVRFRGWVLEEGSGAKIGKELAIIAEDCFHNGNPKESAAAGTDPSSRALSSALANAVVQEAKEASVNLNRESPFGKAVKRAYPFETWRGGKVDDICVVAGVVLQDGL